MSTTSLGYVRPTPGSAAISVLSQERKKFVAPARVGLVGTASTTASPSQPVQCFISLLCGDERSSNNPVFGVVSAVLLSLRRFGFPRIAMAAPHHILAAVTCSGYVAGHWDSWLGRLECEWCLANAERGGLPSCCC